MFDYTMLLFVHTLIQFFNEKLFEIINVGTNDMNLSEKKHFLTR